MYSRFAPSASANHNNNLSDTDALALALRMSNLAFKEEQKKFRKDQHILLTQLLIKQNINKTNILQNLEWQSMFINRSIGVGLQNLGNSCFLNATLQCLAYIPVFAQLMMNANHSKYCTKKNINKFCSLCEMESFISSMHVSKHILKPRHIFRNLTNINNLLRVGCQEDAHEFIQSLLDKCEIAYDDQYHQKYGEMKKDPKNAIRYLFNGETKTSVVCKKCKNMNITPEPFCCLSLEISDADSIDESFTIFSNKELMMGDDKYFCNICKKRVLAYKQITISKLPSILILHLKRFSVEFYADFHKQFTPKKINKHIEFPDVLDFMGDHSEVIFEDDQKSISDLFELCAVLVHSGPKLGYGHYYAMVKSPDGQWYKMNDTSVIKCSLVKHVLKEQAYILFYRKQMSDGSSELEDDEQEHKSFVCKNVGNIVVDVDVALNGIGTNDNYFMMQNQCRDENNDRVSYVHVPPLASRPELPNMDNDGDGGVDEGFSVGGDQYFQEIFWPATDS